MVGDLEMSYKWFKKGEPPCDSSGFDRQLPGLAKYPSCRVSSAAENSWRGAQCSMHWYHGQCYHGGSFRPSARQSHLTG